MGDLKEGRASLSWDGVLVAELFGVFAFWGSRFFAFLSRALLVGATLGCSWALAETTVAMPSQYGQPGYVATPNALIGRDGDLATGVFYANPYAGFYTSLPLSSFFELTLIVNRVGGVPGFNSVVDADGNLVERGYGSFKDKRVDWKWQLISEGRFTPAVAIGSQDAYGTRLWGADYVALTKRMGNAEFSLGYGARRLVIPGANDAGHQASRNRLHGGFGGVRWRPAAGSPWSVVAELDPIRYRDDRFVDQTHVDSKRGRVNLGLEYRWEWLGLQVANLGGRGWSVNGSMRIPLDRREYLPKINEPPPYTELVARPTGAMWASDGRFRQRLLTALADDDFKDLTLTYLPEERLLRLTATNSRISDLGRVVGRAVRPLLLLSPVETQEIEVVYSQQTLPLISYRFFDLTKLRHYFNGDTTRSAIRDSVHIRTAAPEPTKMAETTAVEPLLDEMAASRQKPFVFIGNDDSGQLVAFRQIGQNLSQWSFVPFRLASLLNDPSGAFQYRVISDLNWTGRLGRHGFVDAGVSATLTDSYRSTINPSNSPIPHVRSDVARYALGSRAKLSQLTYHHYWSPANAWQVRSSAGMLEEMFAGLELQALYTPHASRWAMDITLDAVKQRAYDSPFKFLPYQTVSALVGVHYRFDQGYALTARLGRFLARDVGARLEFKRRFQSGIELGGWVGLTNNKDYNASGSQGRRFIDKGVFVSIPTAPLTTRDSRGKSVVSIAEWGRDVAQFIRHPRDLYDNSEKWLIDRDSGDGLGYFGDIADVEDENNDRWIESLPPLSAVSPLTAPYHAAPMAIGERFWRDSKRTLAGVTSGRMLEAGMGLALTAAVGIAADRTVNRWLSRRDLPAQSLNRRLVQMAPLVGAGLAGLLINSQDGFGNNRSVGWTSLEAAALAALGAYTMRQLVPRASPLASIGNRFQKAEQASQRSFPGVPLAASWAMLGVMASAYDAPWLYGLGGLYNAAALSSRRYWLSDVMVATLMGLSAGQLLWRGNATDLQLGVMPNGLSVYKAF